MSGAETPPRVLPATGESATRRRALVIGLDGATFDLIRPWAAAGYLPHLARLMAEGVHGPLASTLQPTTAPAWVTFMTGVNQGKHGLYDFVRRRAGSYNLEVTNASHNHAPTVFDMASQAGRRVVALNVPYTAPPRPVNGVVIGGPFAPAVNRDLVYPPEYFAHLQAIAPDYFVLPDYDGRAADPLAAFAARLLADVELRARLALDLMRSEPWDLLAVVFMATDEAQHTFWRAQEAAEGDPMAPYRHAIRDVYSHIDRAIGAMLAQADADPDCETTVFLVSDHGAGALGYLVNLNHWLAGAGYLRFRAGGAASVGQLRASGLRQLAGAYRRYLPAGVRRAIRTRLGAAAFEGVKGNLESALITSAVDWAGTRAYALGAGGNIYVNLRGREPAGTVEPGAEYEATRAAITSALLDLRAPDSGVPIVKRVWRREDLYSGPFAAEAPDLVIEWADYRYWGRGSYDGQAAPVFEVQEQFDFSGQPLSGAHRPHGILIVHGPGVAAGAALDGARLVDLAPTILSALGLPLPPGLDGVVLSDVFGGAIPAAGAAGMSPAGAATAPSEPTDDAGYTDEEAELISRRLRDLGYL